MEDGDIVAKVLFQIGPVTITSTVVTTWLLMAVLGLFAWISTRRLATEPGPLQTALEGIVASIEQAVPAVAPRQTQQLMPFIGTLWVFLVIANLSARPDWLLPRWC